MRTGSKRTSWRGLRRIARVYVRRGRDPGAARVPEDAGRHGAERARPLHLKAHAPGGPVLSTELLFPPSLRAYGMNVAELNSHDRSFSPLTVIRLVAFRGNVYWARFDFIIAAA
jgi:hypothetical protein